MKNLLNYFKYYFFFTLNIISEIFVLKTSLFIVIRSLLLKLTGIKINKNVFIDRGFRFLHPKKISIGENVSLGHNNKIWAFNIVEIGDYVQTAIGLTIISGSHKIDDYSGVAENQEVILEGENWIGANVTILGGVTIGRGTIIGAGSVVVKSLPPYSVCAGNPCKVIKERVPSKLVISPFGKYQPSFYKE